MRKPDYFHYTASPIESVKIHNLLCMGNRLCGSSLRQVVRRVTSHECSNWNKLFSKSQCYQSALTRVQGHTGNRKFTLGSVRLDQHFSAKTVSMMDSALVGSAQNGDTDCTPDGTAGTKGTAQQQQLETAPNSGTSTLSKRAMKRLARAQKYKDNKRRKKEEAAENREDVGYRIADLEQSSYYFEHGLRKVYPYDYVFTTHAKGRWVGRTIKDVLEAEFGYEQPDDLLKAFEMGKIHVNDTRVTADYTLKSNDFICHRTHRHENPVTAAPIEVIENSDDLVVINKPSSIPCHPCGRYRFNSVAFILGKEMGLVNLRGIYRLDRLTSGVLILGKTPKRTRTLMDQVSSRQVQKEYVCRVVGEFPEGPVKVDQPLAPLSNKLRLQVVCPKGKSSQTTFTRISYNGKSSVVRCIPHTGRTHQIRVHLQYLGHPILNDGFYNNSAWGPNKGKSGDYELPFDKVCERLMKEHHASWWTGGDNPLYVQKLAEVKAKGHNCEESGEHSISKSLVGSDKTLADQDLEACLSSQSILPGQESFLQPLESTPQRVTSPHSCRNPVEAATNGTETGTSFQEVKAAGPGLDAAKWSVDLTCDLCKNLQVNPQEKDLVMFLHALKYKGPGWQYETSLPDWADFNWNREDEFVRQSSGGMDL